MAASAGCSMCLAMNLTLLDPGETLPFDIPNATSKAVRALGAHPLDVTSRWLPQQAPPDVDRYPLASLTRKRPADQRTTRQLIHFRNFPGIAPPCRW